MNGVLVTEIAQLDTDTRTANTAILTDMGNRANARVAKQKTLGSWLTAPVKLPPY